jgi:acetoin utilization protein AcuB
MEHYGKPIHRYMSPVPVAIQLSSDLATAVERMQQHEIRHLPVMDGEKLAGIVSERDLAIVESLAPNDWESIAVAEAMTPEPYAVQEDTPVHEVARVMADNRYGCAVVIDAAGHLRGLFTTTDALRLLAREPTSLA